MKSRPILFSAPMVRALLAGTKTQTRRLVKPQPPFGCRYLINGANNAALCQSLDNPAVWVPITPSSVDHRLPCPYGQPGDRLWVKETHRFGIGWDKSKPTQIPPAASIRYEADGALRGDIQKIEAGKARPSLFMRQAFSRLTLNIAEIRLERLQAITEADARAEGVTPPSCPQVGTARDAYRVLWELLNGPGSWALNPYVWVLTFRRVTP
jgi:hypothetical protein